MAINKGIKIIAENRKAFHDYFIEEKFETGIVLSGTEVKSLRQGKINLKDSYCTIKDGEIFVVGVHISPYEQGNRFNLDPMRTRKLLMHKKEIIRLYSTIKQDGLCQRSVIFEIAKLSLKLVLQEVRRITIRGILLRSSRQIEILIVL